MDDELPHQCSPLQTWAEGFCNQPMLVPSACMLELLGTSSPTSLGARPRRRQRSNERSHLCSASRSSYNDGDDGALKCRRLEGEERRTTPCAEHLFPFDVVVMGSGRRYRCSVSAAVSPACTTTSTHDWSTTAADDGGVHDDRLLIPYHHAAAVLLSAVRSEVRRVAGSTAGLRVTMSGKQIPTPPPQHLILSYSSSQAFTTQDHLRTLSSSSSSLTDEMRDWGHRFMRECSDYEARRRALPPQIIVCHTIW